MTDFQGFPKIPRLSREMIITEKIDGTNAQVCVTPEGEVLAGSRSRWITPATDNHGFASWVKANKTDLLSLGEGHHFGEWWGSGINRGYGLTKGEKRFSLFDTSRWTDARPACCFVVPVLYRGMFDTVVIDEVLQALAPQSVAAPGFTRPEGIVIFHTASGFLFKKTIEHDKTPKGDQ